MSIQKKIYEPDFQTDRAKNVKGEHIYIENAESGRKGYFCIGCDKPMQANIQKKNPNHRSYFSHIPVDLSKGEKKCSYSNREQRELIATDILQRIKRIKVPEVLKFPPKGTKGNPVELEKSKFITTHKVRSQLTFYEDEEGNIHHGKNPKIEERYLLLRPDVIFFNENDEPILFIELVVTHNVTDEKKIKLRRLGIDTISVIVPRGSDQEIEENFKSVHRVKWEYNDKEARTSYLSVSHRTPKGVLEFDEQQRRIFGESLWCRKSRINNTVRTLRKCLDGKSYRDAEQDFEREIFRVKTATAEAKERLGQIEARIDKEVRNQFTEQNIGLERQGGKLDDEERKFEKNFEDLERRYQSKRENIRGEKNRIDSDKTTEQEDGGTEKEIRERFNGGRDELRREFTEISEEFRGLISTREESIKNISRRREELAKLFNIREKEEQDSFREQESRIRKNLEGQFAIQEDRLSSHIGREERNIKRIREQKDSLFEEFRKLEETEQANFREQERKFAETEENLEGTIREELHREFNRSSNKLPRKFGFILEAQRVGSDYKNAQRQEEYYQRAREFFSKGTWEKE